MRALVAFAAALAAFTCAVPASAQSIAKWDAQVLAERLAVDGRAAMGLGGTPEALDKAEAEAKGLGWRWERLSPTVLNLYLVEGRTDQASIASFLNKLKAGAFGDVRLLSLARLGIEPRVSASPRVPEPGEFRAGLWSGRCYRAGYLQGSTEERCHAAIFGRLIVEIERTHGGMIISAHDGCEGERVVRQLTLAELTGPERVERVAGAMRFAVRTAMAKCGGALPFPIEPADIEPLLRETDGLLSAEQLK